jgi:hypothetical protein
MASVPCRVWYDRNLAAGYSRRSKPFWEKISETSGMSLVHILCAWRTIQVIISVHFTDGLQMIDRYAF